MLNKYRVLNRRGRMNNMRYGRIPSRCGRNECKCLMRLDLKDKTDKKFYSDCYGGWYNFHMRNKLEIN
jgi:hypothetical protein